MIGGDLTDWTNLKLSLIDHARTCEGPECWNTQKKYFRRNKKLRNEKSTKVIFRRGFVASPQFSSESCCKLDMVFPHKEAWKKGKKSELFPVV